ncbi:MAG: hypothetical protein WC860_04740 [Candidatus Margulisiibacteriota bacterium]
MIKAKKGFLGNILSNHVKEIIPFTCEENVDLIINELVMNVLNISYSKISHNKEKLFSQKYLNVILELILSCQKISVIDQNIYQDFNSAYFDMPEVNALEFQANSKLDFTKEKLKPHDILSSLDLMTMLAYKNVNLSILNNEEFNLPIGKYKITEEIHLPGYEQSSIKAIVIEPVDQTKKEAYLVFRGTPPRPYYERKGNIRSVFSHFGPGIYELIRQIDPFFELNFKNEQLFFRENPEFYKELATKISQTNLDLLEKKQIYGPLQNALMRLKNQGYKITTLGHSLGGAMAIACYVAFPQIIDKAYARNAPGLNDFWIKTIETLQQNGNKIKPEKIINYNNFGDYIPDLLGKLGYYYLVSNNNIYEPKIKKNESFISRKKTAHSNPIFISPISFIYWKNYIEKPLFPEKKFYNSNDFFSFVRSIAGIL